MKICITALSASLDSPVDSHFGRGLYFVIMDADSMEYYRCTYHRECWS
ncbi:hypothetical protein Mpsy_0686 [Methanolobus psychrophilus R15]|nr:hypothetical protein Mpsy_0686 [Methanolobus psychrophilus R15]